MNYNNVSRNAINCRFALGSLTGVQRVAMRIAGGVNAERILPPRFASGVLGHMWEQFALPLQCGNRLLLSPANTGPVAVRNQILVVHDLATFDVGDCFSRAFRTWYRALLSQLIPNVALTVAVSQFTRKRIEVTFPKRRGDIVCIPNGVDAPVPSIESDWRSRGGYFVVVGSIDPRKNLNRLVEAWGRSDLAKQGLRLFVIGSRNSRIFGNSRLAAVPGLEFLGYLSDGQVASLYRDALATVSISVYEGFGLTPIEAFLAGCPRVVVSTIEPHRENLRGLERAVYWCDPLSIDDIVLALQAAARVGEGISWAERETLRVRHSWETALSSYCSLLSGG